MSQLIVAPAQSHYEELFYDRRETPGGGTSGIGVTVVGILGTFGSPIQIDDTHVYTLEGYIGAMLLDGGTVPLHCNMFIRNDTTGIIMQTRETDIPSLGDVGTGGNIKTHIRPGDLPSGLYDFSLAFNESTGNGTYAIQVTTFEEMWFQIIDRGTP